MNHSQRGSETTEVTMFTDQSSFAIRFEWGERGLEAIGRDASLIVIVDVLSFCTCVDVVTALGATVLPYPMRDQNSAKFAAAVQGAALADRDRGSGFCLSPASVGRHSTRHPLGVAFTERYYPLSLLAGSMGVTVAACLRNASAVAAFVRTHGGLVSVIGCGERWPDGHLSAFMGGSDWGRCDNFRAFGTVLPRGNGGLRSVRNARSELPRLLESCFVWSGTYRKRIQSRRGVGGGKRSEQLCAGLGEWSIYRSRELNR